MKKLLTVAFFALLSINLMSCREKIDAANIGLLIDQYGDDKGQGVALVAGAIWYNPMTKDVVEIPAYVQHKEYEVFTVSDKDGSNWEINPKINYRVDPVKIANTYRKYRKQLPELEEGVIKTIVQEAYRIIINNYSTDSIMRSREIIEKQARNSIASTLDKEGFITEQLTSGMKPPKAISDAVTLKNKAVQDAMRIENEVKSTEAEGMKKIAAAKANYEAQVLNAKGEAEANRLRQQTLTPMLIQQQFIEKWNGQLPVYGTVPQLFKDISR
jgi:regulator of protease activity HflC (stomatin/prohibitin superfamily)